MVLRDDPLHQREPHAPAALLGREPFVARLADAAPAHDVLLCIQTGKTMTMEIGGIELLTYGKTRTIEEMPRTAITYNPYGESVFVIEDKDGALLVQRRPVKTGEVREGRVEILEGLQAGQQVVAAGQNKLRNGQPVSIEPSSARFGPDRAPCPAIVDAATALPQVRA